MPPPDTVYKRIVTGELAGSATAVQMPDIPCMRVIFKALSSNTGDVYIGSIPGVTVADGTTDTTTGFELSPGAFSPGLDITHLNLL